MGRIALIEEVEGIRDEQDVGDDSRKSDQDTSFDDTDTSQPTPSNPTSDQGPHIATVHEVHEAFDSINTLRYSQPTHLQGLHALHGSLSSSDITSKGNARD